MSFTFIKPLQEVWLAPFIEIADADWDLDVARAVFWQCISPQKIAFLFVAGFAMNRGVRRMCAKQDWADKGLFKQRRKPVHERWGPPPPRKYDDDGNLL